MHVKDAAEIQHDDVQKAKPAALRSSHWPGVRHIHLQLQPACQWCGSTEHQEVHHVKPFHLHPELELDAMNLITLCEHAGGNECHFKHGHNGTSWKDYNRTIKGECAYRQAEHETGA